MDAGGAILGGDAIPGDAGAINSITGQLQNVASNVDTIRARISAQGLHGSWSGRAASAFESTLGQLPGELDKLSSSFGAAASALGTFMGSLEQAQSEANWLAGRIEQEEGAMRDAQTRHDRATNDLASAERTHSNATDPVSKASAQHALDQARTATATAQASIDDCNGEISNLRKRAAQNRANYESAVSACANALDTASSMGIQNSTLGEIGHFIGHAASDIAAPFVWVGGHVVDGVEDAGKWVDQHWQQIHDFLDKVGTWLAYAAIAVAVVAIFVQPELLIPLMFAAGEVGTGLSAAETAGDGFVAVTGDAKEKATAEGYITGDAVGLAFGLIPGGGDAKEIVSADRKVIDKIAAKESRVIEDRITLALDPSNSHWRGAITLLRRNIFKERAGQVIHALQEVDKELAKNVVGEVSKKAVENLTNTHHIQLVPPTGPLIAPAAG